MDSSVIECPVCFGTFTLPRVLCCGHSICSSCLEKMSDGAELSCPVCMRVSKTDKTPLNYTLMDVVEKIREHNLELSEIFGICDDDSALFADCDHPDDDTVVCCCFEYSR